MYTYSQAVCTEFPDYAKVDSLPIIFEEKEKMVTLDFQEEETNGWEIKEAFYSVVSS